MRKININKIKLTRFERQIEKEIGRYVSVSKTEFRRMARAIKARKKNAVLSVRIKQGDLDNLKLKAERLGVKYQTFISELLHKIAHS